VGVWGLRPHEGVPPLNPALNSLADTIFLNLKIFKKNLQGSNTFPWLAIAAGGTRDSLPVLIAHGIDGFGKFGAEVGQS
jgi:hypothetical protein